MVSELAAHPLGKMGLREANAVHRLLPLLALKDKIRTVSVSVPVPAATPGLTEDTIPEGPDPGGDMALDAEKVTVVPHY
jgi:hypothetical protein